MYELTYNLQSAKVRRVSGLDVSIDEWRTRLGYPTFENTRDNLKNTTQMVQILQAESISVYGTTTNYSMGHYTTGCMIVCIQIHSTHYLLSLGATIVSHSPPLKELRSLKPN